VGKRKLEGLAKRKRLRGGNWRNNSHGGKGKRIGHRLWQVGSVTRRLRSFLLPSDYVLLHHQITSCIKPECSINSVIYIYDTKGSDKLAYGIHEAGIEAENHYHSAPTVRSQIGNPQKSGGWPHPIKIAQISLPESPERAVSKFTARTRTCHAHVMAISTSQILDRH